jgi:hypothetical protein
MAECGECRPFAHFSESVTRNTRVRLFLQRLRAGRTPPAPPPFRLETCLLITSSRAMGNERPLKKALVQASASRSCASRRARAFSWCSSELMCAPPPHQLGRCCGPPRLSPEPRVIVFVMFNTLIWQSREQPHLLCEKGGPRSLQPVPFVCGGRWRLWRMLQGVFVCQACVASDDKTC